jgi:hypothetical protein
MVPVVSLALVPCLLAQASLDAEGLDLFESRIRPVLVERCYRCHSAEAKRLRGGLFLDSREGLLRGGERGPAIVPRNPGASLLLRALRHEDGDLEMPPGGKLPEAQIDAFARWIAIGAPDPRGGGEALAPAGIEELARGHWAFQPPAEHPRPPVENAAWARTPVDLFILAKLEERGLGPSPEADRRTLIRRAAFDLTGLPPTPEEVEDFAADARPDAYERLVDRLLASPRYGERWGRYWLDVARYADTKGYAYDREERRFVHSHAYRDWVIRAFNEDLPYDRFIVEQLAADQLGDETDRGSLAALGFLTVGKRFVNNIHDIIDDRIDVLTRGLQGLTVSCARCHDHKFDPIPTEDYYSLYGVFAATTEKAVSLVAAPARTEAYAAYEAELEKRAAALAKAFQTKREQLAARLRSKAGEYLAAVLDVEKLPSEEFYAIMGPDDINPVIVRQWQAYLFQTAKEFHPVFAPWHAFAALPREELPAQAAALAERLAAASGINPLAGAMLAAPAPPLSMEELAARYGALLSGVEAKWRALLESAAEGAAPPEGLADPAEEEIRRVLYGPESPASVPAGAVSEIEWFFDEPSRVELSQLQAKIDQWLIDAPGAPPHAVVLEDRPAPRNPRIFIRGNPSNRGREVPRRFLRLIEGEERRPFVRGSGRLELARAIASPENPLTARVIANRIWLHHFGAGLVRTPSDFGTRSEPPSHPELLDFLARRLVAERWSLKGLHRLIMLSSAYRQASAEDPERFRLDPENRWLSRMSRSRLDFEALRDTLLAASGRLDLVIGGRPVELLVQPFSGRRSVYGFIDRQILPGVLRIFDFANPDQHSPQRYSTTVPQQALFFLNSPFVIEQAIALARRHEAAEPAEERVRALYAALFQRRPSARELESALRFLAAAAPADAPAPRPPSPWLYGYGEVDAEKGLLKSFTPLPHWTGDAWQGGPNWPDPKLGWVRLTATGGHTGNDLAHAAVRRWVAPFDGAVSITATLSHRHAEGDGVRARIISRRAGELASWRVHNGKAETALEPIAVREGETIDFAVDLGGALGHDDFLWAPVIRTLPPAGAAAGAAMEWMAEKDFAGPEPPPPLGPWEKYAQALLFANELVFVD